MGAESSPINQTAAPTSYTFVNDDSDKTVPSSSSLGDDDGSTEGGADGSSDGLTLGTSVGAVEGTAVGTVL